MEEEEKNLTREDEMMLARIKRGTLKPEHAQKAQEVLEKRKRIAAAEPFPRRLEDWEL